jgi:hypothetical protein
MSRRQIDPLRPLTAEDRGWLARISRSHSEPVAHVAWATVLLAVAAGQSYTVAASIYGRSSHSYSLSLFLHQHSNQPQEFLVLGSMPALGEECSYFNVAGEKPSIAVGAAIQLSPLNGHAFLRSVSRPLFRSLSNPLHCTMNCHTTDAHRPRHG